MSHRALDKYNSIFLPLVFLGVDYFAIVSAEQLAFTLRNYFMAHKGAMHLSWLNFWVIFPSVFLLFINFERLYWRRMQFWQVVERLFNTVFYSMLAIILLLYVVQTAASTSRLFIFLLWLLSFCCLVTARYLLKQILTKVKILQIPILIIGAGKTAELFVQGISSDSGYSYKIIGFLEDRQVKSRKLGAYPVLGKFADAAAIIRQTGVENVVIAAPGMEQAQLTKLINHIQAQVKNLTIIPNLVDIPMSGIEAEGFFNEKIMLLRLKNNLARPVNRLVKYSFDFFGTLIGTLLITPVLAAIYIWIRLDSPGPVIFRHWRIGKGGKHFACYKFRSMCIDAEERLQRLLAESPAARQEWERDFKLKDDPRITRAGRFLRKTSLDELPQIFNVLKGEMSLVGPRPVVADELERYGEYIDDYLMVRPGITGMWQVNGRSDTTYTERVKMDSWYVRNWSFWLDIMLLWRTLKSVIKCKGAY